MPRAAKKKVTPARQPPPRPQEYRPWLPEEYTRAEAEAIRAVARGDASEAQQKRAMDWLIYNLTRTYDVDHFPDSERDSCFAAGKRWVGQQLVKMIRMTGKELRGMGPPERDG